MVQGVGVMLLDIFRQRFGKVILLIPDNVKKVMKNGSGE
jgi:hypothetical protein